MASFRKHRWSTSRTWSNSCMISPRNMSPRARSTGSEKINSRTGAWGERFMASPKQGVLLLAHGSPDSPQEVPEFLRFVTAGRGLPASVIEEIQHRYSLIGHSPLTRITLQQAEGAA